jgi:hypothetical protein
MDVVNLIEGAYLEMESESIDLGNGNAPSCHFFASFD